MPLGPSRIHLPVVSCILFSALHLLFSSLFCSSCFVFSALLFSFLHCSSLPLLFSANGVCGLGAWCLGHRCLGTRHWWGGRSTPLHLLCFAFDFCICILRYAFAYYSYILPSHFAFAFAWGPRSGHLLLVHTYRQTHTDIHTYIHTCRQTD